MNRFFTTMLVVLLLCACEQQAPAPVYPTSSVKINSAAGSYTLTLEVAKTPEQQQHGLMFRENLAPDGGMIFVYPTARKIAMWMKNTPLSLDMVFLGNDRKISAIVTNTEPQSEKIIESEEPAIAVIELKAGTAKRLGLSVGDTVDAAVLAPSVE